MSRDRSTREADLRYDESYADPDDDSRRRRSTMSAGGGTVLVVDDEEMVRRLAKTTLEIRGYKVLLAVNGKQAVDIVRESGNGIAVVLLDMMMPVMSGEEAMEHIMGMHPEMRVIATSGYDEQEAAQRFGSRIAGFLQKPYTSRQLAEKIRGVIEAPAAAESGGH
jgi:CheY-like chemotaxis protein